jgi:hypothetical protein
MKVLGVGGMLPPQAQRIACEIFARFTRLFNAVPLTLMPNEREHRRLSGR